MRPKKQVTRMSTGGKAPRKLITKKQAPRPKESGTPIASKKSAPKAKPAAPPAKKPLAKKPAPKHKNTVEESSEEDPPIGALSAFMFFLRSNRKSIRENSNRKNFMKAASSAWKKLEDKSEWEQMAKEDKERYDREMAEYNNTSTAASGDQ